MKFKVPTKFEQPTADYDSCIDVNLHLFLSSGDLFVVFNLPFRSEGLPKKKINALSVD